MFLQHLPQWNNAQDECVKILELWITNKNWILKVGDENEDISDILRSCYKNKQSSNVRIFIKFYIII